MANRKRGNGSQRNTSQGIGAKTLIASLIFIGAIVGLMYVGLLGTEGDPTTARSGVVSPVEAVTGPSTDGDSPQGPSRGLVDPKDDAPGEDRTTVLVMGVDRREDNQEMPSRSDTIMLATLEKESGAAGLLSIPRDLYVSIPEWKNGESTGRTIQQKITTACFWGDYWDYPGGGPALAAHTVERNFGVSIDHYFLMDFNGFERAIDAIGGIDIDVERPLVDENYPDDEGGVMTIYFEAGPQHLDGQRALQYARTRNPDSDFGRIQRQQQVIMAIRDKVLQPATWPKVPELLQTVYSAVYTDMSILDTLSLANAARSIDSDDILVRAIDSKLVDGQTMQDGAQVLMPRWNLIDPMLKEMFNVAHNGGQG